MERKATPDCIDYYAALGAVRDSDNDTLVSSYARVSSSSKSRWSCLKVIANAQKFGAVRVARAAARALLSHANATASAARVAVAMARNDLKGTAP